MVLKDELLDAIWPDVVIVEASLPTAISSKLGNGRLRLPPIDRL
jgi:hypothetical protein